MCVELNAHALITYVLTIRDYFQGDVNKFLPWMLGSQTCEKTFRIVRSMSSTFSTVLNFSVLGLLRRLHWLNIQLTLQANSEDVIRFPSKEKHHSNEGKNKLSKSSLTEIKDKDIAEAVQRAKDEARSTLETLGMDKLLRIHSVWDKEDTTEDLIAHVNAQDDSIDDDDSEDDDDIDHNSHDSNENSQNLSDSLAVIEEVCLETKEQMADDLQSAYNGGLISKETNEKLQKMQKVLPIEKVPSETIPMYSLKDHSSLENCISSLSSSTKQVFTPFVEVSVKGRVVLIRKTTAIWLFQESERVSADRLFRVRLKQPYASVCTQKCATAKVIEQHDKIANNKNLKSDNMHMPVTMPKNSSITVAHDQHDKITGKNSKSNDMACTCDTIVINDDDDTSNEDVKAVEICTKSNKWLKIGSYVLSLAEREMLCNNDWLTDLHMNSVQVLLKKQFPQIGGLQNTAVLQSSRIMQSFPDGCGSLQIVHINNNHWVVASTLNCHKSDISVYDSLNSSVDLETQAILAKLLRTPKDIFTIQIAKVNKQSGTNDCGAFAAAYCTSLAFGQDPSSVVYSQEHLRHHLLTCLENQKMSIFPTIRCRRTASTYVAVKVYCNCRSPDSGELMVACDKCKNWYHVQCIDACLKDFKEKKWHCLNCTS